MSKGNREPIMVWGDPPKKKSGVTGGLTSPEMRAFITALRARPGEWACVARRPTAKQAQNYRSRFRGRGSVAFASPGRVEAVCRRTDSDDYGIWARWVE